VSTSSTDSVASSATTSALAAATSASGSLLNQSHMDTSESGSTGASRAPNGPVTCASSTCMFYGSANTEGFCSVCYKKELKRRDDAATKARQPSNTNMSSTDSAAAGLPQPTIPMITTQQTPQPQPSSTTELHSGTTNTSATSINRIASSSTIQSGTAPVQVGTPTASSSTTSTVPVERPPQPPRLQTQLSTSAPVPVRNLESSETSNTSPSVQVQQPQAQPSSSSKRRSDDSFCSLSGVPGVTPGSPSSKKSTNASPSKPKKRKCGVCKKKIGLTGFECRCGGLYCPIHRYADQHSCQFDYQKAGKEQLRKDNPVVKDDKVTKI